MPPYLACLQIVCIVHVFNYNQGYLSVVYSYIWQHSDSSGRELLTDFPNSSLGTGTDTEVTHLVSQVSTRSLK